MFVSNRYFNNKVYFIPWFRVHLKHCSSDHNTSRDLEFDKNVPRLVTTGAINLKKKQSEGNTLLCYEYLFYINTQVQMLKSFNSLLIQKFSVTAQGSSSQNFFSSPLYGREIFLGRWSCAGIFFLRICTCRIFFFRPPANGVINRCRFFGKNELLMTIFREKYFEKDQLRSSACFTKPSH